VLIRALPRAGLRARSQIRLTSFSKKLPCPLPPFLSRSMARASANALSRAPGESSSSPASSSEEEPLPQ